MTSLLAVEALSFRLRSRFGFLPGSGNLLVIILEVPLLSFTLFHETSCRCQNRRIAGRGSRTVRLRSMVTGDKGHDVYLGPGPLDGGNTLLPA